jgi:hypothetical protein
MRIAPLLFIALVVACRSPAEPMSSDAGAFAPAAASESASAAPTSSAEPEKEPPGKYPAIDAFCASSYGADIDAARAKCSAEEMKTQESVVKLAARVCRRDLELLQDQKRWTFDEKSAEACVALLKSAPQPDTKIHEGETFFLKPPCDKISIGARAEGESCLFPPECKDGLACDGYKVGKLGACKKPTKVGDACSVQAYGSVLSELAANVHHAPCAKGAYCTESGKCAARAKGGDACEQHKGCVEGLWCIAGRCSKAPFAAAAATCAKTSDCAFGLFCDEGQTKKICATKRAAGETCTGDQCKGWCDLPPKKIGREQEPGVCKSACGSG